MILLFVVAAIAFYVIFLYNSVITLKNRTQEAWSDIDVQLKRRYNLIPNLVETVKGYAKHEEGVFTKVTEARAKAMSAQGAAEQAQAENMLKDALKSLFAVVENYPELKANANFLKLQEELKDTEDKIEAARRFYNGNVRDFNTKIQKFPNNIIAGQLGFSDFDFFEIGDASQRENVKVDFAGGMGEKSGMATEPESSGFGSGQGATEKEGAVGASGEKPEIEKPVSEPKPTAPTPPPAPMAETKPAAETPKQPEAPVEEKKE